MAGHEGGRRARAGASLPPVPDKLYFRIGEVARLLALPAYVLRFWESEFPQLRPGKGATGQRLYRRRDVEALLKVRQLLYDRGYTIPGARQYLQQCERAAAAPTSTSAESALSDLVAAGSPTLPSGALLQLRANLEELSDMLGRPSQQEGSPASRGLHLAQRRRVFSSQEWPTLFSQDPNDQE